MSQGCNNPVSYTHLDVYKRQVYAQVDSANTETSYGGVHEIHETPGAGLAYDNVAFVEVAQDTVFAVDAPAAQPDEPPGDEWPARPTR